MEIIVEIKEALNWVSGILSIVSFFMGVSATCIFQSVVKKSNKSGGFININTKVEQKIK